MFRIEFTREAVDDLGSVRKYDQRRIVSEVESQLSFQPSLETRRRKRLRPNQLAEWELKIDEFRVFYDVVDSGDVETADSNDGGDGGKPDDGVVRVIAIGRKDGSRLVLRGEEFEL